MDTIKEAVQQKYGEAALQARSGAKAGCGCGTSCGPDPITSNLYDDSAGGRRARGGAARLAGLRQPDRSGGVESRRSRPRSRFRWRHRRAAVGQARGPDRKGLWPGHDRRDAGARPREPGAIRSHERRVPQGRDRAHPASRQLRRRHHLELRHQPVRRQGPRDRRGLPSAEAGRTIRGLRRRR